LCVVETCPPQIDRAKDLHVLVFSCNRNFGRTTNPTPGCM
jgi:hypothetical protein